MASASESREETERHDGDLEELNELSKEIEKMAEVIENVSVQLTCMAYDMVVLRTSEVVGESIQKLEDELNQCKALIEATCLEAMGKSAE